MAKTKADHQYHTESFFVHEEIIHDRVHVHDHKNKFCDIRALGQLRCFSSLTGPPWVREVI